jgi:hypothetical protein
LLGGAGKNQENVNRGICDRSNFETDTFRIKTRALLKGTPVRRRQRKMSRTKRKKNGEGKWNPILFFGVFRGEF